MSVDHLRADLLAALTFDHVRPDGNGGWLYTDPRAGNEVYTDKALEWFAPKLAAIETGIETLRYMRSLYDGVMEAERIDAALAALRSATGEA